MKKVLEALSQMQVQMPVQTIILVLFVALLLSLVIYFTYKYTYSGVVYNPRFNFSIVMITMITTIVMIVIGSNISVSLGMVGALSIVRFRTAVKDPRDTAFIFWGIVVGLACGTQCYYVAIVGSIFVCLISFVFKRVVKNDSNYVLIIRGKIIDNDIVEKVLSKKIKYYICKSKYVGNGYTEVIYDIKLRKNLNNLVDSIKSIEGIQIVNIVQNNTETMG